MTDEEMFRLPEEHSWCFWKFEEGGSGRWWHGVEMECESEAARMATAPAHCRGLDDCQGRSAASTAGRAADSF